MGDEGEVQAIVIDNGSFMIKAGYSGDDAPRSIFPSVLGRPKSLKTVAGFQNKDYYVGDEACAKSGILNLRYPIERGVFQNWDEMEKIWHHTFFNELHDDPTEHPVLLTEPLLNSKSSREKSIQIMFEAFNVPSFYIANQCVLSLYSSGSTDGIIVEIGDSFTQLLGFYEGYKIDECKNTFNVGGKHLTDWMNKLLRESGYNFTTIAEKETVRDIKENKAYVALDYESELQKAETSDEIKTQYELPDGQMIEFGKERFQCGELLFKPILNDIESDDTLSYHYDGIHEVLKNTINKVSGLDLRKTFYNHIIISGG